jgi:thiol:disulfide interchange protein DsbD
MTKRCIIPVSLRTFAFATVLLLKVAVAEAQQATGDVVKVSTFWSATGVKPGGQINLAIVLDIQKPYHVNANTARDPFIPTTIRINNLPETIRSSTPLFPDPHELEFGLEGAKQKIQVFSGRTVIYVSMAATDSAKPGEYNPEVIVNCQACDDKQCLFPTEVRQIARLKIVAASEQVSETNAEIFRDMQKLKERLSIGFFGWDFKIETSKSWLLLIVAAAGGFLLNLTPCVLPLLPLKIIGLSKAAGNRRRCFLLGLTMSAGVVAFWLALAVAILTISGFDATNKLFQYPAFTITVGVIICAMAVGMCGLFSARLPQWVYRINPSQESGTGSFLFGVMTAVLSTPCTAPFMGAAAAWSITQTPAITLSTFGAIGMGMALPYLVLSAFPALVNRMPRAGLASELIKQVMGLLMLAAGAYFLGTGIAALLAKPPDPPTQAYWWIVSFFVAIAGGWLAWRTFQITSRPSRRILFGGIGALLVLAAVIIGTRFTKGSPIHWIYYTPERLAEAQRNRKVVVLEFTAAWCLNCLLLERGVLHHPKVVELMNSTNVAPIKVDITGKNPQGNQKLIEVGRRTIPYLMVYSPGGQEVFSSDAYTVEQLVRAIVQAQSAR